MENAVFDIWVVRSYHIFSECSELDRGTDNILLAPKSCDRD